VLNRDRLSPKPVFLREYNAVISLSVIDITQIKRGGFQVIGKLSLAVRPEQKRICPEQTENRKDNTGALISEQLPAGCEDCY
jgi:Na+-translocating ferredoxin:NAD+ oxidoreductase RNF subunit RnfB